MTTQEKFSKQVEIKNKKTITTHKFGIFTIAEKEEKFFVLVRNYVVSAKEFDTLKQAQNYIKSKPWELIINVSCLMQKLIKDNEKAQS